jgi:hypothetical protein
VHQCMWVRGGTRAGCRRLAQDSRFSRRF